MRPINQEVDQPGQAVENAEDEAKIIADQDETMQANPDRTDEDFGLDRGEFARGEIDLKEQMDRSMAAYTDIGAGKSGVTRTRH